MRIANLNGRLVVLNGGGAVDVEKASDGRFAADPQAVFDDWEAFSTWAGENADLEGELFAAAELGAPVPRPPQVFGIGMNYRDHATEAGLDIPEEPVVFTKFPSSITGPYNEVELPSESVDYEVELVVAIGTKASKLTREEAWGHVAGFMVGQDISERDIQLRGPAPQFSMGKSFPGFSPIGPALVTRDELASPEALQISCGIDGVTLQEGTTRELIFDVPELIARLSATVTLLPGDLIFTGTPAGVGFSRSPQRFIRAGEELISSIEGLGELRNRFVQEPAREKVDGRGK
jgi:2,4-didehydro-3-deoxy-L-rhamnonate hydrolase